MSKLRFSFAWGEGLKKKAFFILAFAFLGAGIFAQQPAWVDSFDKIHDSDTLQKLHSYQKQGWESVFRATGESAAALTDEAELEIQRLRNIIASDDDAIIRSKSSLVAVPTPEQCKPALSNPRDPLFAVCDKSLRQDQLLAISGILKLLPAYEASLPKPEVESHYGKNLSSEVVATLRIRVLSPEPVPANMVSAMGFGTSVLFTSLADDGRTIEVHQGDIVVVELAAKGKRAPGFVVDPVGILAPKTRVVRVDTARKILLRAAKPGLATIAFHGPLAQGDSNDLVLWSGYVSNNGPFWGVKGQWQVPAIARSCGTASTWVGMNDQILLQVGTREEYSLGFLGIGGGLSYQAWWEAYPINAEQDIGKSVNPGDWMLGTVTPTPLPFAPTARMTITNISQGWTFTTDYPLGGSMPKPQAEWILEDPEVGWPACFPSSAQTLADYGQVTFDYGSAFATSLNELNEPIWVPAGGAFTASEQIAFNINNSVFSTPGPPSCDGNGFFVTYSSPGVPPVSNQFASPGPVVNTALLGPAQLNFPYSQILVASDPWAPFQGPWSWAVTRGGLPPGMTLDSSSGVISGKALLTETYQFSVVATNNANFAHASSCPQELSINVSPTALSTLRIQCGGVSPPSPAATIAVKVDDAPAACGSTLNLPPGPHTVVGSVQNGTATTGYKMLYGGACSQTGSPPPLTNPPAVVQLAQGQVQFCGVGAESWQLVESAGCPTDKKCCESSPTGCKRCVKSSEVCP